VSLSASTSHMSHWRIAKHMYTSTYVSAHCELLNCAA